MIVRFYMGWMQMLMIDLPLIVASFWSISAFYLMAYKVLFPRNWKRALLLMPALMAAGVALTISNSKAVLEAITEIEDIELSMPNKHCLLVDLARFGQDNPNEIFVPVDEPHGSIQARLRR